MVAEGHNVTVCAMTDTFENKDVPQWLGQASKAYMKNFDKS